MLMGSSLFLFIPIKNVKASGNTLYVGGSGPGNYTKIQDAVDHASDGDTIFVFHDSSPYRGVVLVTKSVTIQGENKNTTIINSGGFNISASNVTITGFTIQNSKTGVYIYGLGPPTCYNRVDNNIFLNVSDGVNVYSDWAFFNPNCTNYGYNIISNNVILYTTGYGITIAHGQNNSVISNDISQNDKKDDPDYPNYGIGVWGTFTNISYNNIHDNEIGIKLIGAKKTEVYRNTIKKNKEHGIFISNPSSDRVIQNNLINNRNDIHIIRYITEPMSGISHSSILPATFDGNYWGRLSMVPHPIGGFFSYNLGITLIVWYVLFGENGQAFLYDYYSNFVRFDWNPAQEPYDIPG
jgi:parallel beta-helix repeat protein